MSSIICPVCTTFSCFSNNTLNAHIDLCLSKPSAAAIKDAPNSPSLAANMDVSSSRSLRPRKKSLMSDIYNTPLRCMPEGRERRSKPTLAAAVSSLPAAPAKGSKRSRSKPTGESNADANIGPLIKKSKADSSKGKEKEINAKKNDSAKLDKGKGVAEDANRLMVKKKLKFESPKLKVGESHDNKRIFCSSKLNKAEIKQEAAEGARGMGEPSDGEVTLAAWTLSSWAGRTGSVPLKKRMPKKDPEA